MSRVVVPALLYRPPPPPNGEVVELPVDMVIKAAGQMPYEALVVGSGVPGRQGKIVAGDGGGVEMLGSGDGLAPVYAGGDCVNGGKEVVDAVQAGKEAAAAILKYFGISEVK